MLFSAMQLFTMQSSSSLQHTHASSRHWTCRRRLPSDSHGIAERQCLCQRSKQAFTFKLVLQELPRLVDLVSWWQQSARVGFLIALHHRGSISWDVTDVPCMLSPSDRQRRTGLQAVARVCTPSKIPMPRVAQASGVDS